MPFVRVKADLLLWRGGSFEPSEPPLGTAMHVIIVACPHPAYIILHAYYTASWIYYTAFFSQLFGTFISTLGFHVDPYAWQKNDQIPFL